MKNPRSVRKRPDKVAAARDGDASHGMGGEVDPKHASIELRPDMVAAARGGDATHGMDGEGDPKHASMAQALFWKQTYVEILAMEEKVLERIKDLMEEQSPRARHEVELTNVPVVAAQAERFRMRLGYWTARVNELE